MHRGLVGTIIFGITLVAGSYLLLNHSAAVGQVAGGGVSAYTNIARAWQSSGTPSSKAGGG